MANLIDVKLKDTNFTEDIKRDYKYLKAIEYNDVVNIRSAIAYVQSTLDFHKQKIKNDW